MSPHKLSDNQLRLVVSELLRDKDSFTTPEAEQRFRYKFPVDAERLDLSPGHSLHETIGGRLFDYSNWSASKRSKYTPRPPKIEGAGEKVWKAVAEKVS